MLISWDKANEDAKLMYKESLSDKLNKIVIQPDCLGCQDLHCKAHAEVLEDYTMEVLEAIESAGKESLPLVGGSVSGKSTIIPGWSEHVKPYKEESKFWSSVWLSQGSLRHGDIFWNMKHSKNQESRHQ